MPIPAPEESQGRTLLRDGVHTRLRDAIVDGTLQPGEQLRDADLAAWLGVSRTPVREALLRLAESGLVVARPGRSTTVSPISTRASLEARDVVAAMHELAVRVAVPRLTADDLARMRAANRRFEEAVLAGEVDAAVRADDDFHDVPVRVCGNGSLAQVLERFTPVLRRVERLRFGSEVARESVARHADLIRLCEAGDVDGAAEVAFGIFHELTVAAAEPDEDAGTDPGTDPDTDPGS